MKAIGFVSGIALGMAAAVAAVSAVYPTSPSVQSATRSISGAA